MAKRKDGKAVAKVTTDIKCKQCGKPGAGSQGYCTDCMGNPGKKKGK